MKLQVCTHSQVLRLESPTFHRRGDGVKSGEVLVAAHLSDRVHGIGGHTWSAGSLCTHTVMVFRSRWVFWIPVLLQAVLEVKYFWMLFGSSTSSSSVLWFKVNHLTRVLPISMPNHGKICSLPFLLLMAEPPLRPLSYIFNVWVFFYLLPPSLPASLPASFLPDSSLLKFFVFLFICSSLLRLC